MIYIVGTGAIGKALAVFLKITGQEVMLLRGSVDHCEPTDELIKVINQEGKHLEAAITISSFSNLEQIDGPVLVATKTYGNNALAKKLLVFGKDFPIVLLQNGLNIESAFAEFTAVYRSVLFSTSQILDNGVISFKAVAHSPVGKVLSTTNHADEIVALMHTDYFWFRNEKQIEKYIWNKALINCAYNAICPLLEVDNGIFFKNTQATELAYRVIEECVAVAKAYDIHLDEVAIKKQLVVISQKADGQLISTFEDIRNHRRTEIMDLNLEIARMADAIGQPELVPTTRLLGELIHVKSEIRMQRLDIHQ